ncbi:Crotonobetainyl-CoA:carnitine CoA-transferase CaiB [Yoonia tamlensis]|uniref:Crotonobetainyl-CoA:carnitine CoA-transferase CaiB n=1 Tax=Yoonia tamlensis TaxID=390270 RepID=A0A1I6HEB4_9RHOB|nr:CaiB/BaiF CoA-transferase family protein [Yoonia tamlensis]SFR52708.1 Crotonobetainyl-CoA:carnitine CoA-transferase CaiB [Yoonia tamlensis]
MFWPLEGILVVDFSQFLAGPYAALRLQDMGARVIKVENPDGGDLCRHHYLSQTRIGTDSTLFHAINRGKQSVTLDLKSAAGLAAARKLVAKADVVIQNFRPSVIDRLGLGYDAVRAINPDVIYGSISGYGTQGDWADTPGQDLLAQARSGVMWLSGNHGAGPVPIGLPLADISTGANLATGILGALLRHARSGQGAHVETSLLESLTDMQFELLTTYLNNGHCLPQRLEQGSAHRYLGAPYGVFDTKEGQLALAMSRLDLLGQALELPEIAAYADAPDASFSARDKIHALIAQRLQKQTAAALETALGRAGLWCAKVLSWDDMLAHGSFQALDMLRTIETQIATAPQPVQFVRAPFRIDGARPQIDSAGPALNADGAEILAEFDAD